MLAFIALFFPAALMVIRKRKLFDEEYDWKMMALEYVIGVLVLNLIVAAIAYIFFGSRDGIVYNINSYVGFAMKYIFLSSLLALALPWIYLKTDKFQKIHVPIEQKIKSNDEEVNGRQKPISPKITAAAGTHNKEIAVCQSNFSQYFLVASFAFFVFMMLFNLTHSAPWGDEWIEYRYSQRNILDGSLYKAIISTYQPPLYNFLMHFWLLLDKSVLWFRLFNVVCGTVGGIFLHKTVSKLVNTDAASFTLCILGATYRWVYCIQECSEYAIMLMFLFLAFYFYVCACETDSIIYEIFFILSCVGAMYSQYGAFFIVVPLLIFHFIRKCIGRNAKSILRTTAFYIFSLVVFALPLYIFFAKIQIQNNEITENTNVVLSFESIEEFPLVFGELIAYFLNLRSYTVVTNVLSCFGVAVLLAGIVVLFRKEISFAKKSIIGVMLVGYTLFYWLVVFHIYAMTHPDQSAGFYDRYSYFMMPMFVIAIPLIVYEFLGIFQNHLFKKSISLIVACMVGFVTLIGYPSLLTNWNKAYDDIFAEIWVYNAGFDETTFLFGGGVNEAFNYYTSRYSFNGCGEILYESDVDLENLPESFWAWRTNWNTTGGYQTLVDSANEQGYSVTIYFDKGSFQLAHCVLE